MRYKNIIIAHSQNYDSNWKTNQINAHLNLLTSNIGQTENNITDHLTRS
jgi:hypothetical protein